VVARTRKNVKENLSYTL
jgi:hypothetical protein